MEARESSRQTPLCRPRKDGTCACPLLPFYSPNHLLIHLGLMQTGDKSPYYKHKPLIHTCVSHKEYCS